MSTSEIVANLNVLEFAKMFGDAGQELVLVVIVSRPLKEHYILVSGYHNQIGLYFWFVKKHNKTNPARSIHSAHTPEHIIKVILITQIHLNVAKVVHL